jgi:hypothetical protein
MCFSLPSIEFALIWLVIICVVVGILRILVPWILSLAGIGVDPVVARIINLVVIAIVLVAVIVAVFWLIGCVASEGIGLGRVR